MKIPGNVFLCMTGKEKAGILLLLAVLLLVFLSVRVTKNSMRPSTPEITEARTVESDSTIDINLADETAFVHLGFSAKQAGVILRYRNKIGGFGHFDQFRNCYVVSPEHFERIRHRLTVGSSMQGKSKDLPFRSNPSDVAPSGPGTNKSAGLKTSISGNRPKVPLNTADSSELVKIYGIGPVYARRIIDYRDRLGGFVSVGQLREIKGMTDENFNRISSQIFIDSVDIKKIDINFATARMLSSHPYCSPSMVKRIMKARQLKGGWRNFSELTNDDTLLPHEAERLAPYADFGYSDTPDPIRP